MSEKNNLDKLLNDEETIDLSLSYSRISDFDRNGPAALIRRYEGSNEGMNHGSLVDDLLTDKLTGSQICKETYFLYDGNKPTAMLGTLCDIILKNYESIPDIKTVLKIVKHNAFWNNVKDEDKLIGKFDLPEFWDYLDVMYKTVGKKVITTNDDLAAKEAVNVLLTHDYSKHLYFNENENFYQLPFEIMYKNFKLKGILDRLSIDHKNRIVYMDDLKTGAGKGESFLKSFIEYRYYYQGAIYRKSFDYFCEKFNLKNYTLAPFQFVYLGKTEKVPFIFTFTDKWNSAAINGFKTRSGYSYAGLDENIDKIYYHWKNDKYEFSKDIYENNGCLNLNDEFIEVNE